MTNTATVSNIAKSDSDKPGNVKKANLAAIIGGIVGGIVALIALVALIFWLCRPSRLLPRTTILDMLPTDQDKITLDGKDKSRTGCCLARMSR